jgi:hypothetical protein
MSAKRKIIPAAIMVVVILAIWLLALPRLRFSAARNKYVVGMSLESAATIAKAPHETLYPPYNIPTNWKSGEMPEAAKQATVVVALYCSKECVLLGFNSYSNLIEVQPVHDPIDSLLWLRSRK